jgi:heptosyltransferase-1
VVGRMAGAGVFAGAAKPREGAAAWLYGRRVTLSATHVVERGCELLGAAVGETLRPAKVALPVDSAAESWCDDLLACGERFVMMAPTAGWGAKQWPTERFGEVAAELGRAGFRTLVNAASLGDGAGMRVVAASGGAALLVPCSIGQLIAVVRRAGVVIAGDTGPLHLAAALERPVVALFGPTDPARTGPFADEASARVLRHGSSGTDHSRRAETEEGLMQITVAEVVEAALELLEG